MNPTRILTSLAVLTVLGGPTAVTHGQTRYDHPFAADDLDPGERISRSKKIHSNSGTQKWGYDLGAMRYISSEDRWSSVKIETDAHWKNPKNSNYVVYGKPVYAMTEGTIIECWRNAPNNPRPKLPDEDSDKIKFEDREWLSTAWRQKRIPGGGNHVLILQDDGVQTLYAHFIPGSVPAALCPNNLTLYPKADDSTAKEVPKAKQVRVRRGQLLGKVGNSGNSTNPHLHVHSEKGSQPIEMRFRRGLATPLSGSKADIDKWTRFAGQQIPPGPVLIWPPLRQGTEYARHGMPAEDFQRMFDHLADSGYAPEWLDGYSVGGRLFCNMVWRPSSRPWRAYFGISADRYQREFDKASADGFSPVHVESFLAGRRPEYAVIFKKVGGPAMARHGLTTAQHDEQLKSAQKAGLSPVAVSVISVGGQRRYTVLFRKQSIGSWQIKSQLSPSEYQEAVNDNKAAGRHPMYVNTYMHGGEVQFSAIFASRPSGAWSARHGLSAVEYQTQWAGARKQGLLTRVVTGCDGARSHVFAAVWIRIP